MASAPSASTGAPSVPPSAGAPSSPGPVDGVFEFRTEASGQSTCNASPNEFVLTICRRFSCTTCGSLCHLLASISLSCNVTVLGRGILLSEGGENGAGLLAKEVIARQAPFSCPQGSPNRQYADKPKEYLYMCSSMGSMVAQERPKGQGFISFRAERRPLPLRKVHSACRRPFLFRHVLKSVVRKCIFLTISAASSSWGTGSASSDIFRLLSRANGEIR